MNIFEFCNEYYILIITGYLLVLVIITIVSLKINPFPSFKDSALYDIFLNDHIILSTTYSSVFVISLVLSIENVFDLRNMIKRNSIVLELKTVSKNMNLSKVVADEEDKFMIKPSQGIMRSPTSSSKSMSSDDRRAYNLYRQGEAKIILSNFLMIISFLLPSSLILFTSSIEMKCIYYCSTAHYQLLLLASCAYVSVNDILNHNLFRLFTLFAFICYGIDKSSNTMVDFYKLDSNDTDLISHLFLKIPNMILFLTAALYLFYGFNGGSKKEKNLAIRTHVLAYVVMVIAVTTCTVLFPYDNDRNMNDRNQTLSNVVATNWVFIIYLVMITTKNSRRKTEVLEAAYKELNELNTTTSGEKMLFERTLHDLLPSNIVYSLIAGQTIEPRYRKNCCVLVANIEGFGSSYSTSSSMQIFHITDKLLKVMDACVMQFSPVIYKVESRFDAYIVVGGLHVDEAWDSSSDDEKKTTEMVSSFVLFAFLVQDIVRLLKVDDILDVPIKMRIGISSGGLVTGVTGKVSPKFCVFGNALNEATYLEKEGSHDFIHVSRDFAEFLDKYSLLSELSSLYTLEKKKNRINGNDESYWLKAGPMLDLKSRFPFCYIKAHEVVGNDNPNYGYTQC